MAGIGAGSGGAETPGPVNGPKEGAIQKPTNDSDALKAATERLGIKPTSNADELVGRESEDPTLAQLRILHEGPDRFPRTVKGGEGQVAGPGDNAVVPGAEPIEGPEMVTWDPQGVQGAVRIMGSQGERPAASLDKFIQQTTQAEEVRQALEGGNYNNEPYPPGQAAGDKDSGGLRAPRPNEGLGRKLGDEEAYWRFSKEPGLFNFNITAETPEQFQVAVDTFMRALNGGELGTSQQQINRAIQGFKDAFLVRGTEAIRAGKISLDSISEQTAALDALGMPERRRPTSAERLNQLFKEFQASERRPMTPEAQWEWFESKMLADTGGPPDAKGESAQEGKEAFMGLPAYIRDWLFNKLTLGGGQEDGRTPTRGQLTEGLGIKPTNEADSLYKKYMEYYTPLTPEQKKAMQGLADKFVEYIKERKGVGDTLQMDSGTREAVQLAWEWMNGKVSK